MEIEELRIFVQIADAGGVSPAAHRLGISRSAVSRYLARLEADLGVQLLARSTRGAALTEAGLPDGLTDQHVASGALVSIMTRYPLPPAGLYVVRPPGQQPTRKVRVLTDLLIECFGESGTPAPEDR